MKIKFTGIFLIMICLFIYSFYGNKADNLKTRYKSAIIIGATSGIGEAIAKELAKRNYIIGLVGRRQNLLETIQKEIATESFIKVIDISDIHSAQQKLKDLIAEMKELDLIIISSGTGNHDLSWAKQKEIIDVNVMGFAAMASIATDYFLNKGKGHIVGISSIAALKGFAQAPVYSASKAFISSYLQGLRERFKKLDKKIYVTDIQPGFVDTQMGKDSNFWKATPQEAAQQICDTIENKRDHAYITYRWYLIAWAIKIIPDWLFYKLF